MPKVNSMKLRVLKLNLKTRHAMRKHKKSWFIVPLASLALMGGAYAVANSSAFHVHPSPVHASQATVSAKDIERLDAKIERAYEDADSHSFNNDSEVKQIVKGLKDIGESDTQAVKDWDSQSGTTEKHPKLGRMSRKQWSKYTSKFIARESFDYHVLLEANDWATRDSKTRIQYLKSIGGKAKVKIHEAKGSELPVYQGFKNILGITWHHGHVGAVKHKVNGKWYDGTTVGDNISRTAPGHGFWHYFNAGHHGGSDPFDPRESKYINEGSPKHEVPFYNEGHPVHDYYDHDLAIGHHHGHLEYIMQQDGSGLMRDQLPTDQSYVNGKEIVAVYPDSVTVHGVSHHVKVVVRISNIHYYHPWRGRRSIVFARNLYDGIFYNGVDNMDLEYSFYKPDGTQINFSKLSTPALIEMHEIFGLGKYNKPQKDGTDAAANNENFVQAIDGYKPYTHRNLSFSHPALKDTSGESVEGKGGSTRNEYSLISDSIIKKYSSPIFATGTATGGEYGHIGSKGKKDSVLFDLQEDSTPSAVFQIGSAVGYGSFHPDTHINMNHRHPKTRLHKSSTQDGKTKAGKNHYLRLNEDKPYHYTITGTIPKSGNSYYLHDLIPKQASVTGIHFDGGKDSIPESAKSLLHFNKKTNKLTMGNLKNDSNLSRYDGKHYKITIDANVNEPEVEEISRKFTNKVTVNREGQKPLNKFAADEVPNNPPVPTPIYKSTNHELLKDKNQHFTYTLMGTIPDKIAGNSTHYDLLDNIGKDNADSHGMHVSVDSADGGFGKVYTKSDEVHMDLNNAEVHEHAGQSYIIKIHVHPTDVSGSYGVKYIDNQATANEKLSRRIDVTEKSTKVRNLLIKKPGVPPTPIHKWVVHDGQTENRLDHPGQEYTYGINGQIPDRKKADAEEYKALQVADQDYQGSSSINKWNALNDWVAGSTYKYKVYNFYRAYPSWDGSSWDPWGHEEDHIGGNWNPGTPGTPGHWARNTHYRWDKRHGFPSHHWVDGTPGTSGYWDPEGYTDYHVGGRKVYRWTYDQLGTNQPASAGMGDTEPYDSYPLAGQRTSPDSPSVYWKYFTGYDYGNNHESDEYKITDKIPWQDDIVGTPEIVDDNGNPINVHTQPSVSGNTVTWDLNSGDIEALSNEKYKMLIHVKADHLPAPHSAGWYVYHNQAHAYEHLDTEENGLKKYNRKSNIVYTRIKALGYHTHWYDYDYDNNNPKDQFIPQDTIDNFGHNNTNKPHWSIDADLLNNQKTFRGKKIPKSRWAKPNDETGTKDYTQVDVGDGYAYQGSHLQIPLDWNFTDGLGHYYRFGYGEDPSRFKAYEQKHKHGFKGNPDINYADPKSTNNPVIGSEGKPDNPSDNQSFYKPYLMPKGTFGGPGWKANERFIVDTDKTNNGLPFRLDFLTDSYRFNFGPNSESFFKNDFDGAYVHVHITQGYNNHGKTVYDTDVPFFTGEKGFRAGDRDANGHVLKKDMLGAFYNGRNMKKYYEISGLLHATGTNGSRVPLHVHVSIGQDGTNPYPGIFKGYSTQSHGYIASQRTLHGTDFNNTDTASVKSPERTIKYGATEEDNPRTQYEQLVLKQDHKGPATGQTGGGIRSNLQLRYYGLLGDNDIDGSSNDKNASYQWANGDKKLSKTYKHQLRVGSMMDFGFPESFDHQTDINHDTEDMPYKSEDVNHNSYNQEHAVNRVDRLQHVNDIYNKDDSFDTADSADVNLPKDKDGNALDTLKSMEHASHYEAVDNAFDNGHDRVKNGRGHKYPEYLRSIQYFGQYGFAPRMLARDSGKTYLDPDAKHQDPLASNKDKFVSTKGKVTSYDKGSQPDIDRLFTPDWLPLSTGDGENYNTAFEKARPSFGGANNGDKKTRNVDDNDQRLGGNYWNIAENDPIEMYSHRYEAAIAPNDGKRSHAQLMYDQKHAGISIQPDLNSRLDSKGKSDKGMRQHIVGFSKKAIQLLKNFGF